MNGRHATTLAPRGRRAGGEPGRCGERPADARAARLATTSGPRARLAGLASVAVVVAGLAACGESPSAGDGPGAPAEPARHRVEAPTTAGGRTQYGVAERSFSWRWAGAARDVPPLSVHWDADGLVEGWSPAEGAARREEDAVVLSGRGQVVLEGPVGTAVDPAVHHWLHVRLRPRGATRMTVHWRTPGGADFNDLQMFPFDLPAGDEWTDVSLRLRQLLGRKRTPPADVGVDAFRLVFTGEDDADVSVEVETLGLLSDFDDPDGRPFREVVLDRGAVSMSGVGLHLPGAVAFDVAPRAGDRLRCRIALAGEDARAEVTVGVEGGGPSSGPLALSAGAPWQRVELDLGEAAGREVSIRVEGAGSGVLMVGGVTRLSVNPRWRPPIVLYLEDTLRADRLGAYGYDQPTSPALDRIAAEGLVVEHTFAAANWTRPSVSTLMTSMSPAEHGNVDNGRRVPAGATTLAGALARAGYHTVSMITNYHAGSSSGLDEGYDVVFHPRSFGLLDNTSTLTSSTVRDPLDRFLREHADEQLFVYVHTLDPHAPYVPEPQDLRAMAASDVPRSTLPDRGERFRERYDTTSLRYDAEIYHNDVEIARLDETLRELGLAERSLFVFVSDHGDGIGEHNRWQHRQAMFQEEVHVPWILRMPQRIAAGSRLAVPAAHLDVAPTLLGLVGVEPPASWSGRDLSPWCLDPERAPPPERPLYIDCLDGEVRQVAVVLWPFKLHTRRRGDEPLRVAGLYHLEQDPGETIDLQDDPRADGHVERMLALAEEFLATAAAREAARPADDPGMALDPAAVEWMREMGYLR